MSELAIIAPRLTKLIPLLSSDHDGEVIATARAIGRTLQGAGLDFHSLVEALSIHKPTYAPPPARKEPAPAPQPTSLRDIVIWLRTHAAHRMTYKEQTFVMDMATRLNEGRQASTRQANWLQTIFYRLYGIGGEYVP
jgi:hypothetical protein